MIVSVDTIRNSPIVESIIIALAKNNICNLTLSREPERTRARQMICFILQTLIYMNKIRNFIVDMNNPKFIQIEYTKLYPISGPEKIIIPIEILTSEFVAIYEVMYS